jgi:BlaI family penicillinase repressor
MAARRQSSRDLTPAEWEIMKVFWERGDLAARDVFACLPNSNDWAYKTVKTLLSRLVAKGALEYQAVGNSYLYRAVVQRDDMTRREVRSIFQRLAGETIKPVLAHFIEEAELSDDEIRELKRQLDAKRKGRTS